MKRVVFLLAVVVAFFVVLHIDTNYAQDIDRSDPNNTNVGVPTSKKGGRKCYKCNSHVSQTCTDFFNNQTWELHDCGENYTMCRKIIQEAYYDGAWNVRYIRQCAKHGEVGGDEGRRCKERAGTYRVKMRYCHCDNKDGCNGSTTVTLNYAIILSLLGWQVCRYLFRIL